MNTSFGVFFLIFLPCNFERIWDGFIFLLLLILWGITKGHSFNFKIKDMPKYVIEREIPGAGKLTDEQLKSISQTSCTVLGKMGTQIQWVHSYVTGDKIYCVYIAPNEEMVMQHASLGGFPANKVSEVAVTIDPTTAE